ncbi:MAG: hypothetical protein P4L61_03280 [Candidatus Pacebacteria bacterium]|nr:hypothetical protein [Candidatus Paceibacterota bacterium]
MNFESGQSNKIPDENLSKEGIDAEKPQKEERIDAEISPEERRESAGELDIVRKAINRIVETKNIRNEELGYDSQVSIYGGNLRTDTEGALVWDNTGLYSRFDKWNDQILRAWDEHHVKDPVALAEKHPTAFLHMLPFVSGAKRFRGTSEQILENVNRLGLAEYYGAHPSGIEIKQPDIYKKGVNLQDIFHSDGIGSEKLSEIDRFTAVERAGEYLSSIHKKYGGVGEVLANDIIFMKYDETEKSVGLPVLNLPDEIYNSDKTIGENEKKATDLLDFMASVAAEEWRRSGDWNEVKNVLDRLLAKYEQNEVVQMTESFVRRGRLTLPNEPEIDKTLSLTAKVMKRAFQLHNTERLRVASEMSAQLRSAIIETCEKYSAKQLPPTKNPAT